MKSPGQPTSRGSWSWGALSADFRRQPRALAVAALVQALQALVLVGLGIASCVAGITADPDDVLDAELIGIFAIGGGCAFAAVARGLLAARAWARAPSLVWQLILVPVGVNLLDDLPGPAVAILVSVAVILGGMFSPATGAALTD